MSGMVLVTEAGRSRSHDGTHLEGGRCDGSEEGGNPRRRRPAVGQEGTGEGQDDLPKPRRPHRPKKAATPTKTAAKKTGPGGQEGAPRRQAKAAPAKKSRPRPPRGAAAKKAAPPAKAATPTVQEEGGAGQESASTGTRHRPSGPPSVPTPRTPSSWTSSAPCCSRSGPSTRARPWTCGPRPTRWPWSVSPATSSSTRSPAKGARSPSTASATWPCRPRPSAAVEEIDDALRKIDRKTYGGASGATSPSPRPGSGPCRSPGCAWPARAVACHGADR